MRLEAAGWLADSPDQLEFQLGISSNNFGFISLKRVVNGGGEGLLIERVSSLRLLCLFAPHKIKVSSIWWLAMFVCFRRLNGLLGMMSAFIFGTKCLQPAEQNTMPKKYK